MKRIIAGYHYLTPGTTKHMKLKLSDDDQSGYFKVCFTIYKVFHDKEYKGKIIRYDSKHQLYQVEYENGDQEEFYHNGIHVHWKPSTDQQVLLLSLSKSIKLNPPLSSPNSNKFSSASDLLSSLVNLNNKLSLLSSPKKSITLSSGLSLDPKSGSPTCLLSSRKVVFRQVSSRKPKKKKDIRCKYHTQ